MLKKRAQVNTKFRRMQKAYAIEDIASELEYSDEEQELFNLEAELAENGLEESKIYWEEVETYEAESKN